MVFRPIWRLEPFLADLPPDDCGVHCLATSLVQPGLAVAASAGGLLALLDLAQGVRASTLRGHSNAVTDLSFVPSDPCLIVSSARDGTARLFDHRLSPAASCVAQVRLSLDDGAAECHGAAVGGSAGATLAACVDSSVLLYDLRLLENGGAGLGGGRFRGVVAALDELHTDVVTALRFHPLHADLLATAGDDNFLALTNTAAAAAAAAAAPAAIRPAPASASGAPSLSKRWEKKPSNGGEGGMGNEDCESDDGATSSVDASGGAGGGFVAGVSTASSVRRLRFLASGGPGSTAASAVPGSALCAVTSTEQVFLWGLPELAERPPAPAAAPDTVTFDPLIAEGATGAVRTDAYLMHDTDGGGSVVDVFLDEPSGALLALGASAEGDRLALFAVGGAGRGVDRLAGGVGDFATAPEGVKGHCGLPRAAVTVPLAGGHNSGIATGAEDGAVVMWALA